MTRSLKTISDLGNIVRSTSSRHSSRSSWVDKSCVHKDTALLLMLSLFRFTVIFFVFHASLLLLFGEWSWFHSCFFYSFAFLLLLLVGLNGFCFRKLGYFEVVSFIQVLIFIHLSLLFSTCWRYLLIFHNSTSFNCQFLLDLIEVFFDCIVSTIFISITIYNRSMRRHYILLFWRRDKFYSQN